MNNLRRAAQEYVESNESWIDDGYSPHIQSYEAGYAHAIEVLRHRYEELMRTSADNLDARLSLDRKAYGISESVVFLSQHANESAPEGEK